MEVTGRDRLDLGNNVVRLGGSNAYGAVVTLLKTKGRGYCHPRHPVRMPLFSRDNRGIRSGEGERGRRTTEVTTTTGGTRRRRGLQGTAYRDLVEGTGRLGRTNGCGGTLSRLTGTHSLKITRTLGRVHSLRGRVGDLGRTGGPVGQLASLFKEVLRRWWQVASPWCGVRSCI